MEKFLEALMKDSKLMEEFKSQKTPEGLYSVAKPYIGDMSQADFVMALQGLSSMIEKAQAGELTEDDLESASGGLSEQQLDGICDLIDAMTEVTGDALQDATDPTKSKGDVVATTVKSLVKQSGNVTRGILKTFLK